MRAVCLKSRLTERKAPKLARTDGSLNLGSGALYGNINRMLALGWIGRNPTTGLTRI
jgi:hypothetical protein